MYEQSKETTDSDERLLEWAQSFLVLHKEVMKDYTVKYEQYKKETNQEEENVQVIIPTTEEKKVATMSVALPVEETKIFKELKAYRFKKSREKNIKPYYIYNDNQLKDLISKMPRSKEELRAVAGVGEAKINKYGYDILKIVEKYI